MKFLRLKEVEIPAGVVSGKAIGNISTADLVRTCVNDTPRGGLKVEDLRSRIRVLDALDRSVGCLSLEDADAKTLQSCVAGMRWTAVSREIVTFCDAVANLADEPPTTR